MALSRDHAKLYLAGKLGTLLADAGIGTEDVPGQLREPIDEALLMTGTAYGSLATATIADADALGFLHVLRYTGLTQIADAIANRVSVSLDGPSQSRQEQQFAERVAAMRADAYAKAAPFILDGTTGFSSGVITLDTIEPYPARWG